MAHYSSTGSHGHGLHRRTRDLPSIRTSGLREDSISSDDTPHRLTPNTSIATGRIGGHVPTPRRMRLLDYYNNTTGGTGVLSPRAAARGALAQLQGPPRQSDVAAGVSEIKSMPPPPPQRGASAAATGRPALVPHSPSDYNRNVLSVRTPGTEQSPHPALQEHHHQHGTSADAEIARTLAGLSLGIAGALSPSDTNVFQGSNNENVGVERSSKKRRRKKKKRSSRHGEPQYPVQQQGEVETFRNYGEYLRHSTNSLGGVSATTQRPMDPLPRTYSTRDWRRHERGLYRDSTALNEDTYMYALVLKKAIDRHSPLWQDGALDGIEEGYEGCDTETESDDDIDTSCCLPACGNGCCGVQCVCSMSGPLAKLGACATAGMCEWDGGQKRVEEDQARRRRCRILMATLRRAGLWVVKVRSLDRTRVLLKVSAPEPRLEHEAELMRLRIQRADGTWARFKRSKRRMFVGPSGGSLFRSSDKQTLISHIIRSPVAEGGAGLGVHSPLSDSIETALPLHMYARLLELRNDWLTFWKQPMLDVTTAHNRRLSAPRPVLPNALHPLNIAARAHQEEAEEAALHQQVCDEDQARRDSMLQVQPADGDCATVVSQHTDTTYSTTHTWQTHHGTDHVDGAPAQTAPEGPRLTVMSDGDAAAAMGAHEQQQQQQQQEEGAVSSDVQLQVTEGVVPGDRDSNGGVRLSAASDETQDAKGEESHATKRSSSATGTSRARDSVDTHATVVSHITWASIESTATKTMWKARSCGKRCTDFLRSVLYQPLDRIASYFGESVAFYFAWLEFYTWWLMAPALMGLILFIFQVKDGTLDHPLVPVYSLFIALWSTLFLEFWRRRNVELAHRWGVMNYEKEEVKRPQFEGQYRFNPATGEIEKHYPWTRRALKFVVTASFTLLGLVGVGFLMVYIFSTRDELVDQLTTKPAVNNTDHNVVATTVSETSGETDMSSASLDLSDVFAYADREEFWLALSLPSALYGLMIPILDFMFHGVAVKANQWENHATESAYRNHLVWKVFPFRFFNSFVSLFYYAFSTRHSILVLSVQLASFVVGSQIWNNIVAVVLPCLCRKSTARRMEKKLERAQLDLSDPAGRALLRQAKSHAWQESRLGEYDTFQDYTEMLIQFGYVTCFSMAFSLAPLVALLNNFIEIRADAYKLCYNTQRPHARKAGGIGVWFRILQAMSIMSVITNCVHIAFTSTQLQYYLPFVANHNKLVLTFVFEHIVLGLRFVITWMVPHVPEAVEQRVRADNARLSAASLRSEFSLPVGRNGMVAAV